MLKSLRSRLTISVLVVAIVIIGAMALITVRLSATQLRERLDSRLRGDAAVVRPMVRNLLEREADDRPPPKETPRWADDLFITVVDGADVRSLGPLIAAPEMEPIKVSPRQAAALEQRPRTFRTTGDGPMVRSTAVRISDTGVIVVVGRDVAETERSIAVIARNTLLGAAVGLFLLGLLCAVLVRRWLRPLDRLVRIAEDVRAGDTTARAGPSGPTEVARVGAALDGALDRLTTTAQQLAEANMTTKRFVSDAAHELRTPVSVVAGYAELDRRGALNEAQRGEALQAIGEEATRLRRIVDSVFAQAVLNEGSQRAVERVNVGELASRAVVSLRDRDPERPVGLVVAADDLTVHGNTFLIERAIDNVVRNAEQHTPPATAVELVVIGDGEFVVVNVRDEGPGVTAAELDRLFDRYHRGSDGLAGAGIGTGLGLAIVRDIANAHGGTASAAHPPQGGFQVTIRLARCAAPAT